MLPLDSVVSNHIRTSRHTHLFTHVHVPHRTPLSKTPLTKGTLICVFLFVIIAPKSVPQKGTLLVSELFIRSELFVRSVS